MPQSLHEDLARAAEQEAVSLNTLITGILASSVGWHERGSAEPEPAEPAAPAAPAATGRRWGSAVLVANLVVVAVATVAALTLLVIALTDGACATGARGAGPDSL